VSFPANVAAAGVWLAVPLTGHLVFQRTARLEDASLSPITAGALMTVVGLAVWSLPLLGSAVLGVYRPAYVGLAGWAAALLGAVALRRHSPPRLARARLRGVREGVLVAGLLVAAVLYLRFPTESIYGGRDEGVYANSAVYMAHHGTLEVPYPWSLADTSFFAPAWTGFPGFYKTPGTMTVQFGHLFSVWLAQAYATLGEQGLFRLNGVFAVLALAVIYDAFQLVVGAPVAVAATLFLAFNPSELWVARITLSEILTQLFIWSGICLWVRALKDDSPVLARWAGVCLGMAAFVRFDSALLLAMLLAAHLAFRLVVQPPVRARAVWNALYVTALPLFALALAYFFVFSRPYFMTRTYLLALALATGGAALVLAAARPTLVKLLRPGLTHRATLALFGVGIAGLAAYAYWIRPLQAGKPEWIYQWPGFYIDLHKGNYRSDSLVDLALYLSPIVVWAAIGGWYVSLWRLLRSNERAYLAVPLILVGGFSVVYLYDHLNTPDHLWWIRRFIPVVVPGVVLYAAVAAKALLERLPSPWSLATAALALLFLVGLTAYKDRLILTFAEDRDLFKQFEQLAQRLPAGVPIIAHGHKSWLTPLYLAFDRQVIPLDLGSAPGKRAWKSWIAHCEAVRQPVHMLLEIDEREQLTAGDDVDLSRSITEPTIGRLPEQVLTIKTTFRIINAGESKPTAPVTSMSDANR
jgi:hypothetical protein